MRTFLLSIFFTLCLCSFGFTLPVDLSFSPEVLQRISIPNNVAGQNAVTLKKYEVELAQRITETGDNPFLSHKLGSVLFHQGREEEAVRLWKRTSKQEKNLPSATLMQDIETLYRLLAQQKNTEAQRKLSEIEKKYSNNPHFVLIQAEKAMQSGNLDTAGELYRRAIKLGPGLFVTHLNYARYLDFSGETAKAEGVFNQTLKLSPENKDVLTAYAIFNFKRDNLTSALELFEKIRSIDATEPRAEVQLAVLSLKLRDYYGARYWYQRALAKTTSSQNPLLVALSDVQMRLGLYREAEETIKGVLKTDRQVPLLIAMGTIKEAQNDLTAAETFYREASELEPDYIVTNNNLAMLLLKMNKGGDEALSLAEKAYVKKSDNPTIKGTYGCALFYAGKLQQAKTLLSGVIKQSPADAWSRYCYGSILFKEKNYQMAQLHLEAALLIDPDFIYKSKIEKMLARI